MAKIATFANFEGQNQLNRNIKTLLKRLNKKDQEKVLFSAALPLVRSMQAAAPSGTGKLRKSLGRRRRRVQFNETAAVEVGIVKTRRSPDFAFYAAWIEFGITQPRLTKTKASRGTIEKQSFILEPYENLRGSLLRNIAKKFKDLILRRFPGTK